MPKSIDDKLAPHGLFSLGNSDDKLAQQIAVYSATMYDKPIHCFTTDWCRRTIGEFNIQEAAEQSVMPMEDMSSPQGSVPKGGTPPTHSAHNMQRNLDLSELDARKEKGPKGGALLGTTLKPVPELGTMCTELPHGLFPKMRVSKEDLKQCGAYLTGKKNPKTTLEVPGSLAFELPGYPVDNLGTPMLHKPSKQEKEDLCTACHEPATGRVDLKHHHSAPGLNPNFPVEPDAPNCNRRILSSQRLGDVTMGNSSERCGLYVYSRLSPCYIWPLTTKDEMKGDTELRFETIADTWRSPVEYMESYNTPADRAERLGLGKLSRYLLKYGNLMTKATPNDLKEYLRDLWKLSQDSCTIRGKQWIPFHPANFTQFQAGHTHGGTSQIPREDLLSVGKSFLVHSDYEGGYGPWGLNATARRNQHSRRKKDLFEEGFTFNVKKNNVGFVPFSEVGIMWRMLSFTHWSNDRIAYALLHMDAFMNIIDKDAFDEVCDTYPSFKPMLGENLSRETDYGCGGSAVWEQGYNVASRSPSAPTADTPNRRPISDKRWGVYGTDQSSTAGIWTVDNTCYANQGHHQFLGNQCGYLHWAIPWFSINESRS